MRVHQPSETHSVVSFFLQRLRISSSTGVHCITKRQPQAVCSFSTSTPHHYAKPKKAPQPEEIKYFGRPSNNLKIGVVGLPNVGKSSFFNAMTSSSVAAENYPFCTIDPSEARAPVPDPRFQWLCSHYKPKSVIPAFLTVTDIAGLVKGASAGEGLGNAFLANIRSVDGIYHVVRAFENPDIVHVEGNVDPVRDMEIIHQELRIKDEEFLTNNLKDLQTQLGKLQKQNNVSLAEKKAEIATVEKCLKMISEEDKDIRTGAWKNEEIEIINTLQLLTAKPVTYIVNVSEEAFEAGSNTCLPEIQSWVNKNHPGDTVIPFSASLETKLADAAPPKANSALPEIIVSGYKSLHLHQYFTAGADECRAWTIRKNTKAPQAAGVIHTDFERGFIATEVTKFEDLKSLASDVAVKNAGKLYQKGRDYVVEDGDIMIFKFNKTQGAQKNKKK